MAKQRTLHDLYVVGKEVTLNDGDGDDGAVVVWVQKISPAEHAKCVRRADADRARMILQLRDHDSDEYLTLFAETIDQPREVLIDYLIIEERAKLTISIEAELELGEDSAWAKDNYLQGLRTAWGERLEEQWIDDENDPEAVRVLAELKRFAAEVDEHLEPAIADLREAYSGMEDDTLRQKVIEQFVDMRASRAWMNEYERTRLYHAVRRPENHRAYYFESYDSLDTLPDDKIREDLMRAYQAIEVQVAEGKGSPRATSSSRSSESPAARTEASSGPATSGT